MEEIGAGTEAFFGFGNRFAIASCTASVPEINGAGPTKSRVFSSSPQ